MRRFVLLVLPLALFACDGLGFDSVDFGDFYSIAGGTAPVLVGNRLEMEVNYSGGCEEHEFDLRSRTDGDAAEVWFEHNANGDNCDAVVNETLSADLPSDARDADRVTVLLPNGVQFVVREP